MHVLITGGAGFIGQMLARALLDQPNTTVLLLDIHLPPIPSGVRFPQNARTIQGDLCNPNLASSVVTDTLDVVYMLHGIMSAQAETEPELGMRVNVDASRKLLDAIRAQHPRGGVRAVFASSQAVYGRPFPERGMVDEMTRPTPESSYGMQKLLVEGVVNDYSRRGWVDGWIVRLPNVAIRGGKPSSAAGAFISGIIREPLKGEACVVPIPDRGYTTFICSPKTLVRNLLHVLKCPRGGLRENDRVVNMPGSAVTIQGMRDVLERVGPRGVLGLVKEVKDPGKEKILRSWVSGYDATRALKLGFVKDGGFEEAVREYVKTLGEGQRGR